MHGRGKFTWCGDLTAWRDAVQCGFDGSTQGLMVACTKETTSMTSRQELLQERKMHVTTRESHVSRVSSVDTFELFMYYIIILYRIRLWK